MVVATAKSLRKFKPILLVSEMHIRVSPIFLCSHDGPKCLYFFIKTRRGQPEICLNCLRELNILENFDIIKLSEEEIRAKENLASDALNHYAYTEEKEGY